MTLEPDYDMLAMIFGDWDGVDGDTRKNAFSASDDTAADQRVAEFAISIAQADAGAIEDDRTRMGVMGRLNRGQFGSEAARIFGWPSAEEVRDAVRCRDDDARRNTLPYQALCKIQRGCPELHTIIFSRIAWDCNTETVNIGPFGNNWGE